MKEEKDRELLAEQIVQAFNDCCWVDVFYESPSGYQRVYDIQDLNNAIKQNRAIRVLDKDLLTVILRY